MWRSLILLLVVACSNSPGGGADDGTDEPIATLEASTVAALAPDYVMAIAAIDDTHVAVARGVVSGDAFCPDCVDLDPSECPAQCTRTAISLAVLDTSTGVVGSEVPVQQVFPKSFDHDVNQLVAVSLGGSRVGVAWLDCDNSRCGAFAAKQSCTAKYTVADLANGTIAPVATLYETRFGHLQLVANAGQLLAVTGMPYGAFGASVRAAIFRETGEPVSPWAVLGGKDAHSPTAAATAEGFAIAVDDRRPNDLPPATPCPASCDCSGMINVDPVAGGVYMYELGATGIERSDRVAVGVVDDGHLPNGHYHDREVLALMRRGDELVLAASQAIDMDAELFIGRRDSWIAHGGFDSPIPLWIGVLGVGDTAAWVGSQPEDQTTVNRIAAGITNGTQSEIRELTDPTDSYVFQAAPLVTPDGIPRTFLLRGMFERNGGTTSWKDFQIVDVSMR